MIIALLILCVLALGFIGYLFMLHGRTGHPGLQALKGWRYAHRGLHGEDRPENSTSAFRAALDAGFGIELDLHLMQDGALAVIHDASLRRTAGVEVFIEDLTAQELEYYPLTGSGEKIPLFSEVLALYAGRAPMIVELKSERNNYKALTDAAVKALEGYEGAWCMESFDPRCIRYLKRQYPHIVRGQLSENFLGNPNSRMPWILKLCMTCHLFNFLSAPDFIAYNFADRKRLGTWLCRKFWGIQGVVWTLRSQEQLQDAEKEGYLPIFENFLP